MSDSEQFASELYQRGREAMERREFAEAAALFRSSVELLPHFKTLELLGECLLESSGASSDAIVFLAAAAGLGNKSFKSYFLLARALALRGKIHGAIEKLDIAIELQPEFRAAIELRDALKNRAEPGKVWSFTTSGSRTCKSSFAR